MTISMPRLGGALTITLLSITLAACGGSTPSGAATAAPASQPPASVAPEASPTDSPTASAAGPGASLATTGRIEVADKGFAVTLPSGWTRINLGGGRSQGHA